MGRQSLKQEKVCLKKGKKEQKYIEIKITKVTEIIQIISINKMKCVD